MLSYADVYLGIDHPELLAWIEARIPPTWVNEFTAPAWSKEVYHHLSLAGMPHGVTPERPLRLHTLWWPRGASRWAVGRFLAHQGMVDEIFSVVAPNGQPALPAPLVWDDGAVEQTTGLYLLPPRPLAQVPGDTFGQPLYLLTLVDERYYWPYHPGSLVVVEDETTWANLYTQLAGLLGISLSAETISSVYGTPSTLWDGDCENPAVTLDALAQAVGQRIIRRTDGVVEAIGYTTSQERLQTNVGNLAAQKLAGGVFLLGA